MNRHHCLCRKGHFNLIKKHNLGFFVDYSKYPLDIFFKKLNKKKKNFKPFKNIKQFSREEQNKKLLKIIE